MIKHLPFLVLTLFFLSCEKDDICIEGSENTNRFTIGFVNYKSRSQTGTLATLSLELIMIQS